MGKVNKKKLIIIISIIMAIVLSAAIFLVIFSKKDGTDNTEEDMDKPDAFTDIDLISGGVSGYRIVTPQNPSSNITLAANELNYFFKEAANIQLPIVDDKNLSFNESDKVLSLGNNSIYKSSKVDAKFSELGADGFKLTTKGSSVIMAGGSDKGTLYAAYEFLSRTFNLEVYAEDEYYIDTHVKDLKLKDFNFTDVPDFNRRSVGLYRFTMSSVLRSRLRQEFYSDSWILWSHSYFKILPKETYHAEHPDWYSHYNPSATPEQNYDKAVQLCLTNDEMRAEFTKNVIQLIKDNPQSSYLMLGHEDNNQWCDCDKCKAEIAIYKESGNMMRFVNKVADDVQRYIDENEPGRIFYLGTFGYLRTEVAPVTDTDGKLVPIDSSVVPRDNVYVMVAPIRASYAHGLYDDVNISSKNVLLGWKAVAEGKMFAWIYNKMFREYFIPYNNFSTWVENYEILKDLGVQFVYHQGNKETETGALQQLVGYVQAKLMWDTSQNPEVLASNFIKQYYKDAAEEFQKYYDLLRYKYSIWQKQDNLLFLPTGTASLAVFDSKYWTRDYLDQLDALFVNMLSSIEKYRNSDEELFEKLELRIKRERLTVQYLYLRFYFSEFSYKELEAMIDEFEDICRLSGISQWQEIIWTTSRDGTIASFLDAMKKKLYAM